MFNWIIWLVEFDTIWDSILVTVGWILDVIFECAWFFRNTISFENNLIIWSLANNGIWMIAIIFLLNYLRTKLHEFFSTSQEYFQKRGSENYEEKLCCYAFKSSSLKKGKVFCFLQNVNTINLAVNVITWNIILMLVHNVLQHLTTFIQRCRKI